MLIAVWPVLILIIGLVLWFASSNGKVSEAGKLMFFAGLFWLTYSLTGKTVRFG